MKIYSLDKLVKKHLEYIKAETGDYPYDWLSEIAEQSYEDVYREFPEYTTEEKWDLIEDNIEFNADSYVDFIRDSYPERIRKEA